MNLFKVLQFSADPDQLETELNRVSVGWNLIQLIPVTKIEPQIMINGQPKMKLLFMGIFCKTVDEHESKE
jgi:hypothetical protein